MRAPPDACSDGPCRGFARGPGLTTLALLVTAAGVALVGLLLEALFRAARLQSLQAFDAWAFWVPKAKALYFFEGLDEQVFTTSAGPTYPPLLPIVDAAAFHAMGSVDVVTLHLQFWFLLLGAVAALAGCLYRHVPAWLLWPSLLVVLVVPRFGERLLTPQADVLVDVFFVVAALLVALWLDDRRGVAARGRRGAPRRRDADEARGHPASPPSSSRRGSSRRGAARRRAWPLLGAVALVVVAAAVPWRLWYRARDVSGRGARRPRPRRERRPRGRRAAPLARRPLRDVALVARALPARARARRGARLGRPPPGRLLRRRPGAPRSSAAPGSRTPTPTSRSRRTRH